MLRSARRVLSLALITSLTIPAATGLFPGPATAGIPQIFELLEHAVARKTPQTTTLARQAAEHVKAGKLHDAARVFDELAGAEKGVGTDASQEVARRFERTARALRAAPVPPSQAGAASLQAFLNHLPEDERTVLKAFDTVAHVRSIVFVSVGVKKFVREFEVGVRNPNLYLLDPRAGNKTLVDAWLNTAPGKRMFVAGAGADAAFIRRLKSKLEGEGFTVFFYSECGVASPLCRSETVGAFFATAGHALVADTPAGRASLYLSMEVGAAQRLHEGKALMILVTPSDVVAAAGPAGVVTAVSIVAVGNDEH